VEWAQECSCGCDWIGLDKLTKLSAVFAAYVQFCNNTYHTTTTTTSHNRHNNSGMMSPSDLEFYHCQVLRGSDTAEASALMKKDRLYCRTSAKHGHRQMEAERLREQRESDRKTTCFQSYPLLDS